MTDCFVRSFSLFLHDRRTQVIKMVCIMLAAFVICWVPMQVAVLYSQFVHSTQYGEVCQSSSPILSSHTRPSHAFTVNCVRRLSARRRRGTLCLSV